MFEFLTRRKLKNAKASESASAAYSRLVARAAEDGDLSDADGVALAEAAKVLGIPLELAGDGRSVASDLSMYARWAALQKDVAGLEHTEAVVDRAETLRKEHRTETEKMLAALTSKRGAELEPLTRQANEATAEATRLRKSREQADKLGAEIFYLVGREDPAIAAAKLARRRFVVHAGDPQPAGSVVFESWMAGHYHGSEFSAGAVDFLPAPGQDVADFQMMVAAVQSNPAGGSWWYLRSSPDDGLRREAYCNSAFSDRTLFADQCSPRNIIERAGRFVRFPGQSAADLEQLVSAAKEQSGKEKVKDRGEMAGAGPRW